MTPRHFTRNRHVAIMEVTPDLAANWLEYNKDNRILKPKAVDRLVVALTEGRYRFNGDAIRFSSDGKLLDSQHRLNACIESGVSFTSVVVWGVEPEAQITMDRGSKRTLIDHLRILGEHSTKELATVLNLAVAWDRGDRFGIGARTDVAYEDAHQYLVENPNVRASLDHIAAANGAKVRKVINPAHFAFIHWILSRIDPADADDFTKRFVSGQYIHSEFEATHRLHERLKDLRNDKSDRAQEVIPLAFKAWNLYRDGDHIKQLRIRRGGSAPESFPEPR